ncbi:MAG: CBS domain-containing protein [Sphingomonadaceae bacterium]
MDERVMPDEDSGSGSNRSEATRIQELAYQVPVREIMTSPAVTVAPTTLMREARELMKSHRISGLPVLKDAALVGIVTVEDLFRWLEGGGADNVVADWMIRKVRTVRSTDTVASAINKFAAYKVGRLPVVDPKGVLVGIVTPGDVMERAVRALEGGGPRERPHYPVVHCALKGLLTGGTGVILRYDVRAGDFHKAGTAATTIKRILECFGLAPPLVRRAGTAAYEAEMNLAIHATNGGKLMAHISPHRLVIQATDDGPGIPDIEKALTPGFSTATEWIRELGFGAGMGLSNIQNCADDFSIKSEVGKGTVVRIAIDVEQRNGEKITA